MKFQDMIRTSVPRPNKFDRSHTRKMTMNGGVLAPCLIDEVLPGDDFRCTPEMMARLMPMVSPLMGRQNIILDWWYVPTRLLWDEFEKFITGGVDGLSAPVHPFLRFGSGANAVSQIFMRTGSLFDYFGLPVYDGVPAPTGSVDVNALPFRAYAMVWNENYRDQSLEADIALSKASGQVVGAEATKIVGLRNRAWEKDYFTSAQFTAQRGPAAGVSVVSPNPANVSRLLSAASGAVLPSQTLASDASGRLIGSPGLTQAKLEQDQKVMITDLRKANRVQLFAEKMQLSGARFKEYLKHMWNEVSPDSRLQRPEHLGSSRSPIVISEVLSSVEFEDVGGNVPQGNMSGHGISVSSSAGFRRRFPEHGYVLGLVSILPRTNYVGGFGDKFFIGRSSKFDYYTPDFAGLGEQPVENIETGMDWTAATVRSTFGYQSRYCEYKFKNSTSVGQFRNSLAHWTDDRIFTSPATLNENFIKAVPTKRFFAVTDEAQHSYLLQMHFNYSCIRKIPYFNENRL
uniref:Putative capsid VP1 n=1 Tax=uncultured virus TaxID=340016 RepID=A0A1D8MK68_9VIRU|nr:putative capsid VP1 [uncultured virus]